MNPGGAQQGDLKAEAIWRDVLLHSHHHRLAFLPGRVRCTACNVVMKGLGGTFVRATTGIRQSRKNPNFCNLCDDMLPDGGAEVDIAVLFAHLRGSTALAEKLGPKAFAARLNRFYDTASRALIPRGAMIDTMGGDEVVAVFFPNRGPRYRASAVVAAVRLMRLLGYGSQDGGWVPVGVGIHAGTAFCGRIGVGGVHDVTALGDTMSIGARLQAQARAGEIVMSEEMYREVSTEYPGLERRSFPGRETTLHGRVLKI